MKYFFIHSKVQEDLYVFIFNFGKVAKFTTIFLVFLRVFVFWNEELAKNKDKVILNFIK